MKKIAYLCLLGIIVVSCWKEEPNNTPYVEIYIEDSPADLQKVIVVIDKVELQINSSWIETNFNPQSISIMDYTGGDKRLLVGQELPAGLYTGLRLTFNGTGNTFTKNDLETPLVINVTNSVVELPVNMTVTNKKEYIYCDMDVAKSVDMENQELIPHITVIDLSTLGAISGSVIQSPKATKVEVMLVEFESASGVISSTYTHSKKNTFFLRLPEGTYTMRIIPNYYSEFEPMVIPDIVVEKAKANDIGKIQLETKPELK